jgi:hypothetical protein
VLLSVLPHSYRNITVPGDEVAVFRYVAVKRLSSDNLVDSMIGLQLKLKLKRVVWQQAVLSVDLSVKDSGNNTKVWMGDLERLLDLAFIKAENVNRVLVRFVDSDAWQGNSTAYTNRVIAATDVRHTDLWLSTDLSKLANSDPLEDILWKQRLRLIISGNNSKTQEATGF